jgi:hypothetical protein
MENARAGCVWERAARMETVSFELSGTSERGMHTTQTTTKQHKPQHRTRKDKTRQDKTRQAGQGKDKT